MKMTLIIYIVSYEVYHRHDLLDAGESWEGNVVEWRRVNGVCLMIWMSEEF